MGMYSAVVTTEEEEQQQGVAQLDVLEWRSGVRSATTTTTTDAPVIASAVELVAAPAEHRNPISTSSTTSCCPFGAEEPGDELVWDDDFFAGASNVIAVFDHDRNYFYDRFIEKKCGLLSLWIFLVEFLVIIFLLPGPAILKVQ